MTRHRLLTTSAGGASGGPLVRLTATLTTDRSLELTGDRISWPTILALHLLPGLLATVLVVAVVPLARGVAVPPGLTLVIGSTLIGGLMQLGFLLLPGWRRDRRLSLAGVVHYRERTPRWEFVALVAAVLVYALAVLILLMPLQQVLAAHLFWWLPAYLQPNWDPLHAGFSKVALWLGLVHCSCWMESSIRSSRRCTSAAICCLGCWGG